jgi:hypothetical protein
MLPRSTSLIAFALLALAACTSTSSSGSSGATSGSSSSVGGGGGGGGGGDGGGGAAAGLKLRVLFIGNSYTYANDLPGRVRALAASSGVGTVDVDSVVAGGATLQDHVNGVTALDRIAEGGWTHVVLQGQSLEPLFAPGPFEAAAKVLADDAKAIGAVPVFYETWARAAGDPLYDDPSSGGTPAAMQAVLRAEYQKVASDAGGVFAPAGDAWEQALAEHPSIQLFAPDGSHPSVAGTYLVGCVFHAKLTGHSPFGIPDPPPELSAGEAEALQQVAADVASAAP